MKTNESPPNNSGSNKISSNQPTSGILSASYFVLLVFSLPSVYADSPTVLEIQPTISVANAPRLGLNLGEWSVYGASQFMSNILKNPGFEGQIDRTVIVVAHSDEQSFDDDTSWNGRPDGFWKDGEFQIRTGVSAGLKGKLADSQYKGVNGLPVYTGEQPLPPLATGDVIIVSRFNDHDLPTHWNLPKGLSADQVQPELTDKRPGSPGLRSLALNPVPGDTHKQTPTTRVIAYFDSIGNRAGKLLPVNGPWQLSLWAKAPAGKATLRINFQRQGTPPFLRESVALGKDWKLLEFKFNGTDSGPAATLSLDLGAEDGKVLLDDVSLGAVTGEKSSFRPEVLAALDKLKPGYLRDWQGQLGTTFDNLVAPAFARHTDRYRPGPDDRFGYGLPEFLDLCQKIGAIPWVTVPTTFNDDEYVALGKFLSDRIRQQGFSEIVAEFGNENWNALFRPGGIPDAARHGLLAQRAFANLRRGAGNAPIRLTVNGQAVNPHSALKFLELAPYADQLAIAPYLLLEANQKDWSDTPWPILFQADPNLPANAVGTQKAKKELAVYEVNLHTTRGDLAAAQREQLVAGEAAGSALAQRLLEALNLGVRKQCVYSLTQFDMGIENHSFVKLFGILRDVGATQRFRPQALALRMLNTALPGDVYPINISSPYPQKFTAAAIRKNEGWAVAIVSASSQPESVLIKLPQEGQRPSRLTRLSAESAAATNENEENVVIGSDQLQGSDPFKISIPPWGLVVLTP